MSLFINATFLDVPEHMMGLIIYGNFRVGKFFISNKYVFNLFFSWKYLLTVNLVTVLSHIFTEKNSIDVTK